MRNYHPVYFFMPITEKNIFIWKTMSKLADKTSQNTTEAKLCCKSNPKIKKTRKIGIEYFAK